MVVAGQARPLLDLEPLADTPVGVGVVEVLVTQSTPALVVLVEMVIAG